MTTQTTPATGGQEGRSAAGAHDGSTDGRQEVPGTARGTARGTGTGQEASAESQEDTRQGGGTDRADPGGARGLSAGQQAIAAGMTEAELEQHVWRLIEGLGLLGYHTHDSRRSQPGYPDWTICGRTILFRELKKEHGRVTEQQRQWLRALKQTGADVGVWRPSSLLSGEIAEQLTAISALSARSA